MDTIRIRFARGDVSLNLIEIENDPLFVARRNVNTR